MQTIDKSIINRIRGSGAGSVFSPNQFLDLGSRSAVGVVLHRLVKAGKIRRIGRGLYDLPRPHPITGQTAPNIMATVRALMEGSHAQWQFTGAYAANALGLSDQVPAKIIILTDGVPRRVALGKLTLVFRRAAPRNLLGAGGRAGLVIQALRYLKGSPDMARHVAHLKKSLDADTKKDLAMLAPSLAAWVRPVAQEIRGKQEREVSMDGVLTLSPKQRVELFEQTTQQTGIETVIVEKDFWVCWTLKELFQLPAIGEHLIFKGGTSLSKVFKVIERFSEDIDVSIDRGFLGFGGGNEPEAGASNKEKQRRIEALKTACQQKIAKELLPALEAAIKGKARGDEKWSLRSDDEDPDQQTLLFDYPTSFAPDTIGYIRRMVKIEMGARADHWPSETRTITPYVAEQFPQGFKAASCAVKVLSAERTFWEKATILHAEFHRPAEKPMPERFSRHYCDFHELIRKGVAKNAMTKPELLARVAQHKNVFFKTSWARYREATRGSLRIAPPESRVEALRDDYAKMQQMFFGEPPEFDKIITLLSQWEREFNQK